MVITPEIAAEFDALEQRLRKAGEWEDFTKSGERSKREPKIIMLNVPYKDKDDAKLLGARWNAVHKKWYIENDLDVFKFQKWWIPD